MDRRKQWFGTVSEEGTEPLSRDKIQSAIEAMLTDPLQRRKPERIVPPWLFAAYKEAAVKAEMSLDDVVRLMDRVAWAPIIDHENQRPWESLQGAEKIACDEFFRVLGI